MMDRKLRKQPAKDCPLAERKFFSPKYTVPKYRSHDYASLDAVNQTEFDRCVRSSLGEFDHRNEAAFLSFVSTVRSLEFNRTAFFMERELPEPLLRSKFGDLQSTDVRWRLPCFRIVVPLGALSIQDANGTRSITDFTIARVEPGDVIGCPAEIAREVDNFVTKVWRRPNLHRLEHFYHRFTQDGFVLTATSDRAETYGRLVEYSSIKANNLPDSDNTERGLLERLQHLATSVLLLLGALPIEYEPQHLDIERQARREGEHLIPALVRARFVGSLCIRPIKCPAKTNTGSFPSDAMATISVHRAPHLTSGHWKHQFHGAGRTQSKLVWIESYKGRELEQKEEQLR
jgi:hypothetical protein